MAKARSHQGEELLRRIRLRFEQLGITKNELARRIGAAGPTVIEWFTQGALPDGEKLARLPEALEVNGHWLLTGDGPMLPPGAGSGASDQAFRLGAQAVTAEVRRFVSDLEQRYTEKEESEAATQRAARRLALTQEQADRARQEPGRRKRPRRRAS